MKQLSTIQRTAFFVRYEIRRRKLNSFTRLFNLFFIISPVFLFSFWTNKNEILTSDQNNSEEWILDKIVSKVELYHMSTECEGRKAVFLKFINKNEYKVKVNWKEAFTTQMGKDIKGAAGQKKIILSKFEIAENNCSTTKFKEGRIFAGDVNPTYIADILAFEFNDIKVERLQ